MTAKYGEIEVYTVYATNAEGSLLKYQMTGEQDIPDDIEIISEQEYNKRRRQREEKIEQFRKESVDKKRTAADNLSSSVYFELTGIGVSNDGAEAIARLINPRFRAPS